MQQLYIILSNNPGMDKIAVGVFSVIILGVIMFIVNTSKEKIVEYKLKNNPNDIKLLTKLAKADVEESNINGAILKFEQILEVDNDNLIANLALGIFYYAKKEHIKSKACLVHFFALKPDSKFINDNHADIGYANYYLGHLYHIEEDLKNAEYHKQNAIAIDKRWAKATTY